MRLLLLLAVVGWRVANLPTGMGAYPASPFVKGIKSFAKHSFTVIGSSKRGNIVYSPVGASMVLTMMTFGAGLTTERELRRVLSLPENDFDTKTEIIEILDNLKSDVGYEMRLANNIFLNETFWPKSKYVDMVRTVFSTAPQRVNFADAKEAVRFTNLWAEQRTNGRITEIFETRDVTLETSVLLASVADIKGKWSIPFAPQQTMPREFYVNGRTAQNVTTMFVSGNFRYGELPLADATFVEIPYKVPRNADTMSMYVILPNRRNGLRRLMEAFRNIDEFELLRGTERLLNVYLPKFKLESSIELRETLNKMGVRDMFDSIADFWEIAEEDSLMVTSFVQKASIEVTDDSSAVIELDLRYQIQSPNEFRVDHPFVCVIMKEDGIPLFIARIKDPLQ